MFEPRAHWQIAEDGTTCYSPGMTFTVDCFDSSGRHSRRFGFDVERRKVEEDEVVREQERRMRGIQRMPALHPVSHHPAVTALRLLDNGQVWVREAPDAADMLASWVIFGLDGIPLGRLVLPAGTDVLAARDSLYLINAPEDGGLMLVRIVPESDLRTPGR
jgi:hypothetical protein